MHTALIMALLLGASPGGGGDYGIIVGGGGGGGGSLDPASDLELNVGSKLIFDADADGNNYFDASDAAIRVYAEGSLIGFFNTSGMVLSTGNLRLYDSNGVELGNDGDQSLTYTNGTGVTWANPIGDVFTISDTDQDVSFNGGLNLNVGEKIVWDTGGTNPGNSFIQHGFGGTYIRDDFFIAVGGSGAPSSNYPTQFTTTYTRQSDNYEYYYGTGLDYWHVYNSTAGAYEFHSTNVDGSLTDGKVWWVEDTTDDVNFNGGVNLNVGEKLVLDGDADSNDYIASGVNGRVDFYVAGINSVRLYNTRLNILDNRALAFGTGEDQTIKYTDGTGVTWANPIGDVFTISDTDQDVSFNGGLNLNAGEKLVLDGDATANDYITSPSNGQISFIAGGSTQFYTNTSGMVLPDNKILYFGTGGDQSLKYTNGTGVTWANPIGDVFTISDTDQDVSFNGGLNLNVGEKLVLDGDEDSDTYISSLSAADDIKTYVGGVLYTRQVAGYNQFATPIRLDDSVQLRFGSGADQTLTYTDGTGVTWANPIGDVFTISDTDQDVSFNGGVNLNVGSKLILDADADGNNYFYSGADTIVDLYVEGTQIWRTSSVQFSFKGVDVRINTAQDLILGSDNYYWHTRNFSAGAYEFHSTNVDGSLTDGIVWSVDDGTDDVNFNGGTSVAEQSSEGHILIDCDDDPYTVPATANYVTVDTDTGTCTGDMNVTLPAAAASTATQGAARIIRVKRFGSTNVVVGGDGGTETIDGATTFTLGTAGEAAAFVDTNAAVTDWAVY